ncbi:MAG: hypothetical protein ACPG31_05250 [Planctomycetota bacterium]
MIWNPFFWGGILAVAFFFLTLALVGLSWFAAPSGKQRLLRAEGVAMFLMLLLTGWLGQDLWNNLQGLLETPEPSMDQITEWARELVSMMIVGLSLVFGSLLSCFSWVRAGFAGNGIRSVVWALAGLKVVLWSVALIDLMNRATNTDEPTFIPDGELAGVSAPILEAMGNSISFWLPLCAGLFLSSIFASLAMRRK